MDELSQDGLDPNGTEDATTKKTTIGTQVVVTADTETEPDTDTDTNANAAADVSQRDQDVGGDGFRASKVEVGDRIKESNTRRQRAQPLSERSIFSPLTPQLLHERSESAEPAVAGFFEYRLSDATLKLVIEDGVVKVQLEGLTTMGHSAKHSRGHRDTENRMEVYCDDHTADGSSVQGSDRENTTVETQGHEANGALAEESMAGEQRAPKAKRSARRDFTSEEDEHLNKVMGVAREKGWRWGRIEEEFAKRFQGRKMSSLRRRYKTITKLQSPGDVQQTPDGQRAKAPDEEQQERKRKRKRADMSWIT